MQTTLVIDNDILKKSKIHVNGKKENFIDYYLNRNSVIRWYNNTNTSKNNQFYKITGLLGGVGYTAEVIISEKEAKSLATFNNTEFLVKYIYIGQIDIPNIDQYGEIYRCIVEDVKDKLQIFDEIHIIFDNEYNNVDYSYINKFYGNIYDYIKTKKLNI